MKTYIGIDPSINSTGICIHRFDDNNNLIDIKFFIVKPNKLKKKEEKISINNFSFILYEKIEISKISEYHLQEFTKTKNLINLADKILEVISKYINENTIIVMEGVSYGSSLRTKSIFDLAGLNYLIRNKILQYNSGQLQYNSGQLLICPPTEIKKFAAGKGNAQKDIISTGFIILFPEFEQIDKIDDIADAYYMSKFAIKN